MKPMEKARRNGGPSPESVLQSLPYSNRNQRFFRTVEEAVCTLQIIRETSMHPCYRMLMLIEARDMIGGRS